MEVKLPRQLQESNPNLTNFVHTPYLRKPPCWYCRRHVQALVLLSVLDRPLHVRFSNFRNCFVHKEGAWSHELMLAFALRVSHTVRWKKKFCVPQLPCKIDSRNFCPLWWNVKIVGYTVWLLDRGSAITSSMEKAEWGWAVNGNVPAVGQSVRPSWYRAPPEAHDHVFNTAVIRLDPSLTTVDLSFVSNHTNLYRITKNLRSAFLHVFPNWTCGCVLNSMCSFSLRKSREYNFPQTSGLTRRAVNFANNEIYSSAKTFPLPIPFWKCGSS
jgi:hypothetical protein